MVVLPFRRSENVSPIANYVQVSPVDKDVAAALVGLAKDSNLDQDHVTQNWIEKQVLDDKLAQLSKGRLESRLLIEKNIFEKYSHSPFAEEFARSVIYRYDAQKGLACISLTPVIIGSEVRKYFTPRNP